MCVLSHSVGWKRKFSTKIIVVYRIPNEFDVIIIMMATLVACLWNWHLRCFGIRYLNAPHFCCTYDAADYVISVGQMQFWKAKIFPTKLIRWRRKNHMRMRLRLQSMTTCIPNGSDTSETRAQRNLFMRNYSIDDEMFSWLLLGRLAYFLLLCTH